MTDRELLELAAKAAGYHLCERKDGAVSVDMVHEWNPLADDGDALRLAVKLGFLVDTHGSYVRVSFPYDEPLAYDEKGDDPYAATRRAITRAAAEIGRMME